MIEKTAFSFTIAALVALGVVAPVNLTPELFMQWGLAGVVVALVLWRDWVREKRMSLSIERQTKWIQETLLSALKANTKAIDRCYHLQGGEVDQEEK